MFCCCYCCLFTWFFLFAQLSFPSVLIITTFISRMNDYFSLACVYRIADSLATDVDTKPVQGLWLNLNIGWIRSMFLFLYHVRCKQSRSSSENSSITREDKLLTHVFFKHHYPFYSIYSHPLVCMIFNEIFYFKYFSCI